MLTNFFLHLHPVSIKKQGIALSYTWCMGGITFFLFLVETVTGVLLMFYYRPTLEWAYNDILALRDVTSLGGTDWGMLQAGIVISMIPCILFYLLLQRYYVSGLTQGALK